jgi:hypothetical protein
MLSEYLNDEGIDVSLMTGLDLKYFELYGKALMEDETDTINIAEARNDSKAPLFLRALNASKEMFDRVDIIQHMATEYEKKAIRIHANLTRSWPTATAELRKAFLDSDIYEIVESYFKILRKYSQTTTEEPYYFLHPKHRRAVKYGGEMLKRNTQLDDNEIKVSLLEELL